MKDRKKDHIELAFEGRTSSGELDPRFSYEPMMAAHPDEDGEWFEFLGKRMQAPIWISSMTGGTEKAGMINRNLARVCHEFGLGMGLGSCRVLLKSDEHLDDFDLRGILGDELPFYANLGIAQVEELVLSGDISPVEKLVARLGADGLVIHVNPLQEWLQPEGNRFHQPPILTIQEFLEMSGMRLIVKEVGQGMGEESLRSLLALPLEALEFAAYGGTNFSRVEMLRSDSPAREFMEPLSHVGHNAIDMIRMLNRIIDGGEPVECRQIIVSGGIRNFLDGYYLTGKCHLPAIYGQASEFLKHASASYEELSAFAGSQIEGLKIARAFLRINNGYNEKER